MQVQKCDCEGHATNTFEFWFSLDQDPNKFAILRVHGCAKHSKLQPCSHTQLRLSQSFAQSKFRVAKVDFVKAMPTSRSTSTTARSSYQ